MEAGQPGVETIMSNIQLSTTRTRFNGYVSELDRFNTLLGNDLAEALKNTGITFSVCKTCIVSELRITFRDDVHALLLAVDPRNGKALETCLKVLRDGCML
jgi:hypothetical protein